VAGGSDQLTEDIITAYRSCTIFLFKIFGLLAACLLYSSSHTVISGHARPLKPYIGFNFFGGGMVFNFPNTRKALNPFFCVEEGSLLCRSFHCSASYIQQTSQANKRKTEKESPQRQQKQSLKGWCTSSIF
jgi:hypothetical protein